jgi:thymidylate synthase
MHTTTFHEAYRSLLSELVNHGYEELNARTSTGIKLIQGGYSFKISLANGRLPVVGNRRYFPHVAAAETAWQFMGTKDPEFILEKAPRLWSKFVEDGELKTAYGWRWREAFGRDQLGLAMDELRNNPTNRQLFVLAWDPRSDGLGGPQPKNVPCPVGFTLSRFLDTVHMSVFIRSSDVFVGLPYDVMAYALTLDAICASVGCSPGTIHFTLAHPHLYRPHFMAAQACVHGTDKLSWHEKKEVIGASATWRTDCSPGLPAWSVERVLADPDGYVDTVRTLAKRTPGSTWDPAPVLVE